VYRVRHRCHHKSAAPPWAHTIDTGEDARVSDHRSRTPFHKVVTEVTTVTLPEASRTGPD
jgi:hypothetical protein